jgi:hypothetical protein
MRWPWYTQGILPCCIELLLRARFVCAAPPINVPIRAPPEGLLARGRSFHSSIAISANCLLAAAGSW